MQGVAIIVCDFYAGEVGVEIDKEDEGENWEDWPRPAWGLPCDFFFFFLAGADDFFVFILEPVADGEDDEGDGGEEVIYEGNSGDQEPGEVD